MKRKIYRNCAPIGVLVMFLFCLSAGSAQVLSSIRRASLAPGSNVQGESYSYDPKMDGSGRFVVYTSTADNFTAPGSTLGAFHEHVYLRDTLLGTSTQLDVTAEGFTGTPGLAFLPNVRVFRSSFNPDISRDGRYIIFSSSASNISPDGAGESFGRWAYLKNRESGEIRRIPFALSGDPNKLEYPTYLAVNADGSVVAVVSIVSDVNESNCSVCGWQLTIYDRGTNTTTLVDTGVAGNKFNVGISDDGRFVVFENQVGDFSAPTYAYLYDRVLGQLTALNDGRPAGSPAISGDAAWVAYSDRSGTGYQIKLRERATGTESVVSGGIDGSLPAGLSEFAALSYDGRFVAFLSTADNLVSNDFNGMDDIFVFDRILGKTSLVSVQGRCGGISTQEKFNTGPPTISSDGSSISFAVLERLVTADIRDVAGNLIESADNNRFDDIYVARINYAQQSPVFKKGIVPPAPFVSVDCSGREARFQLENILTSSSGSKLRAFAAKSSNNAPRSVTQQVVIQRVSQGAGGRETVKRLVGKRNSITTSDLPPGVYAAQVEAKAKYKDGRILKSKPSASKEFTISP